MTIRVPASLRLPVPLILLGFAATLSTINFFYHVPRAERIAEEDVGKRLAQEMSRLQSTLEYLLLKGDLEAAQREIAVLAHNHDYILAALTDDQHAVIASTRRAWLGRTITEVLPKFDPGEASKAIRERRARTIVDSGDGTVLGYAGILMGSRRDELRPSRNGSLILIYDLNRYKTEARAHVLQQSLYWAGWVTALALALWLVFHFLLTRRTAQLVRAAEQLAGGNLAARSNLRGRDELGRLSRAFDAMALEVANTQDRLREDIAERVRAEQALRVSEASYRAIFDATEDAVFVLDIDSVAVIDANPKACEMYGHTREELLEVDTSRLRFGDSQSADKNTREMITRARAGGTQHFEWHLRHRDGSMHWEEVFVKRVSLGGQDRLLALIRDITEKKRSVEELTRQREAVHQREKLAALGSLLAGVSHELNNPLFVVVARAAMLEERGDPATQAAAVKIRTRVFEPYFTTKPTGIGTGVGLAVSFGIVEAHGGTLTLACPIEGGAMFTVALPVGTVDATDIDATPSGEAGTSRRTILIVDDEAEIRETLADILTGAQHRVVTASSGREALEQMAREHYDVILTDIRMPDLDGRALYREIERRWPERAKRVIFVTGDTLTSTLRDIAMESGCPVIEKPFLPSEVRRVVAELVANGEINARR